jgi:hypothetical protein
LTRWIRGWAEARESGQKGGPDNLETSASSDLEPTKIWSWIGFDTGKRGRRLTRFRALWLESGEDAYRPGISSLEAGEVLSDPRKITDV